MNERESEKSRKKDHTKKPIDLDFVILKFIIPILPSLKKVTIKNHEEKHSEQHSENYYRNKLHRKLRRSRNRSHHKKGS